MPEHDHNTSCSVEGDHNHGVPNNDNSSGKGQALDGGSAGMQFYTWTTNTGNHTHIIHIGKTGGNKQHENRPPFVTVVRWRRTA